MSLFGGLLGDVEDDPFFGSHMRHMRQMSQMSQMSQMNNMMSLFSDPFGMFGGENPLAIMGSGHGGGMMMPFMPTMAPLNRLFSGDMSGGLGGMGGMGSSYSSSTVIMSSGPEGKPQVYSSSSSTKIGPNGVKETRKTLEDSRTGTKKMSIGHHIGSRAHVVQRAHNLYSGEREEEQEFINIEEDDAEEFDREFQEKSGGYSNQRAQIMPPPAPRAPAPLAIAPAPAPASEQASRHASRHASSNSSRHASSRASSRASEPCARRPLRTVSSPLATSNHSAGVRSVYSGAQPQRPRARPAARRHE